MSAIKQTELLAQEKLNRRTAMHWIGGQWLDSGEYGESINPATGEVIGIYAKGGRNEAELAVNAAVKAFRETDWKDNRSLRARVLNAMATRFEARAEHLAQLLSTEVGKILPHARFETGTVPFNLRFNAALALTEYGRAAEVSEDSLSIVIRQPIGVAGIFAPWNAPIALGIRSLAPALAAGLAVDLTAGLPAFFVLIPDPRESQKLTLHATVVGLTAKGQPAGKGWG